MRKLGFPARRILVRLGALIVVVAAGAAALGWNSGETPLPPPGAIPKETWALRDIKAEDPTKLLNVLLMRHPWAGFIDASKRPTTRRPTVAAPKQKTPWRLAGIVQRGDDAFALIATGAAAQTKIEYRRVGESLPDGSILVQIMPDSAKTQSASPAASDPDSPPDKSETRVYRLFDKK